MNFISRNEAREKLLGHWVSTRSSRQLLMMREPNWGVLRNYEYEVMLGKYFAGEWCITDWCPFNGRHCRQTEDVMVMRQVSDARAEIVRERDVAERLCVQIADSMLYCSGSCGDGLPSDWREQIEAMRKRQNDEKD